MKKFFALVVLCTAIFSTANAQKNPVNVTAVLNENRTDWVYVVTMATEHGILPVIVRRDLSDATLGEISTDATINSAYYAKDRQKWVSAVATVGPELIEWHTAENKFLGNLTCSTANTLGMELFAKANLSVAPDENRKNWVYIISLVTDYGTLPIIIRRDLSHAELAEVTDKGTNSAYFVKSLNKWVPATAVNGNGYMEWINSGNGIVLGDLSYSVAMRWNMPLRNGHPSVNL